MKLIILFTFAFLFVIPTVFADEFIVKSFNSINNKILTNKDKVYDDNDELCAIIMVRTSLTSLGISASNAIVGSPKRVEGDIRVHLTAGTRMIKFFKDGFSTLEYVFPEVIEKGSFYILELEFRRTETAVVGNTMGFVLINSTPQGADVTINGEPTGLQTPFQNPYNEGYYNYTLKLAQYLDYSGDFTIVPDETQKLNNNLEPDFGAFNLTYSPSNEVTVLIDGIKIDKNSPVNIEKLSPGEHTLTVSKSMYETYEQSFNINRNQTTTLVISLLPNFGSLNLSFTPTSAVSVIVDGITSTQNSPYNIQQLSQGKHTLTLSKNQYITHEQDFTITKGEITTLNIELQANFGDLIISTTPEVSAKVTIDNKEYPQTTPLTLNQFPAGKHSLRLSKSMYLSHQQDFIVEKGVPLSLEIALTPTFGMIDITAELNADIYIDKQKVASGTYSGRLLKGIHIIEIKKEKYNSQSKQVDIKVRETYAEQFTLLPKKGVLSVMTTPAEADVYLNNKLQGQTPKFINNLIIGTYTLKLQKQGYATIEKQVEVTENQTTTINETLPSAREVQITSNPTGAKLYVDEQYIGITPQTVSLSFAEHSFKLEKDEFKDFHTTSIIKSTTNNIGFDMESVNIGLFTDTRNGQTYKTIKIGNQTWMAENLNYSTNNSWCYDNEKVNCEKYGRLYFLDAAKNACPIGWHLPSDNDWKQLEMHLGMNRSNADNVSFRGTDEGKKMKSTSGWYNSGNGINSSGFNAFPGGLRSNNGSFSSLGSNGYWWASSEQSGMNPWRRGLNYDKTLVHRYNYSKTYGFSIRCLKN